MRAPRGCRGRCTPEYNTVSVTCGNSVSVTCTHVLEISSTRPAVISYLPASFESLKRLSSLCVWAHSVYGRRHGRRALATNHITEPTCIASSVARCPTSALKASLCVCGTRTRREIACPATIHLPIGLLLGQFRHVHPFQRY